MLIGEAELFGTFASLGARRGSFLLRARGVGASVRDDLVSRLRFFVLPRLGEGVCAGFRRAMAMTGAVAHCCVREGRQLWSDFLVRGIGLVVA